MDSDDCSLCNSLTDYKSKLLNRKGWENHKHECVKCGWRIDDIYDGHSITWKQITHRIKWNADDGSIPESVKSKYLNGYWIHAVCSPYSVGSCCPYCAETILTNDHYCV